MIGLALDTSESARVIVVELASKVLEDISSRVRPPADRPDIAEVHAVVVDGGPVERLAEGDVQDADAGVVG